jgi:hypothetical protein
MGGPPGIPGNPLPAEPKEPGLVELGIVPIPCTTESDDKGAAATLPTPPEGSIPFCRLSEDGFDGLATDELLCARAEGTQTAKMTGRASRRTRIIETSLSYLLTEREHTKNQPRVVVREAGIEPARHC